MLELVYVIIPFHLANTDICGEVPTSAITVISTTGNDCSKVYRIRPIAGPFQDGTSVKDVTCTGDQDQFGGYWDDVSWTIGK